MTGRMFLLAIGAMLTVGMQAGWAQQGQWHVGLQSSGDVIATLSNGTLTISGTGDMQDFTSSGSAPWYNNEDAHLLVTNVIIEDGVTNIGNFAFQFFGNLTSTTIGNSVVKIGQSAFWNCRSLTTINYNATNVSGAVTTSPHWLDSAGINGPVTVNIGNNVTNIPANLFYINDANRRPNITTLNFGTGIQTIGAAAFSELTGLTAVTIPNSVTNIGISAFSGCTGLTAITIPSSVTTIGFSAFLGCTGLTHIHVDDANTAYSSVDGVLFNEDKSILLKYPEGRQGAYNIPSDVTTIGNSAFFGCAGLTSVTIPSSVTTIGISAFSGCTGLTSVTIPNSVTTIEAGTFRNCTGLISIIIPNSVTTIENTVFENCTGLTTVTIGNSVASIGTGAFRFCANLTTINFNAASVTSIDVRGLNHWLYGAGISGPVTVNIGDNVISIPDSLFHVNDANSRPNITTLNIGTGIQTIGASAFRDQTGLASVTILNPTPPAIAPTVFFGVNKATTYLYVPQSSTDAYNTANEWKDFNIDSVFTVTFNSQGGSIVNSQAAAPNDKAKKPTEPTRTDYTFGGWYKDVAHNNVWDFDKDIVTANTTLYAKWDIVVSWNANGGAPAPAKTIVNHGSKISRPAGMTRVGYTFGGWYKDAAHNNAWDFDNDVVTASITLYAKWNIVSYTVAFSPSANGTLSATVDGVYIVSGALVSHGKMVVFTAIPANGYKISGWTLNGNALTDNAGSTAYILANVTAAAVVTVSFDITVSVLSPNRDTHAPRPSEEFAVAPVGMIDKFTAGPNPINRQFGITNFFWQGKHIESASLSIYDASGNFVKKINITDKAAASGSDMRIVGVWDLTDRKGRLVADGTYLIKGTVTTRDGGRERVSVIVGVR